MSTHFLIGFTCSLAGFGVGVFGVLITMAVVV